MNLHKIQAVVFVLFLSFSGIAEKPNVLFIAVDDLRLQTNCYGKTYMHTPNIDRLASEGMLFNRAYCNVPVCGASRASLLSGIRPTPKRFVNFAARLDHDVPQAQSLVRTFRNNGYETVSIGKVYHDRDDNEGDWVRRYKDHEMADYQHPESQRVADSVQKYKTNPKDISVGLSHEWADVPDTAYSDGRLAPLAIEELAKLKENGQPFFLGVGFFRPHLPFIAPKKYWDLYQSDDINLADNPFKPDDAPQMSMHNFGELRRMYTDTPLKGAVSDALSRKLVHAYYASVSFVDAQIGMLLNALDELELRENTIVILWGDHGWFLGEHGLWCKHSNYHLALNAPLLVSVPDYPMGKKTSSLVEFVDIYPSLCELAEITPPDYIDGTSFVPILKNAKAKTKDAVFCRFAKGESIVTDQYSYTEWHKPKTHQSMGRMLYDLKNDKDENQNLSEKPAYSNLVKQMHDRLIANKIKTESKVFD